METGSSFDRLVVPQTNSDVTNRFRGIVCFKWSVDVYRLACTVKLFDIFGWALSFGCKFAFETKFCKFDPYNDLISQFSLLHIVYLAEMRILSYQGS
jgi:hypothetical protein